MKYTNQNAEIINQWKKRYGLKWMEPISHETFLNARNGEWDITLTPVKAVPHAWLGDVKGKKILGLASGGGQQMPVLSALGAECTVLDISREQLAAEKEVAAREGYRIRIIEGDMTQRLPFADGEFDMIVNPVSNHYIEDVFPVFAECRRVLKPGGELLCGLDTGIYWVFDDAEEKVVHSLPFNPLKDRALYDELMEKDMGLQFSHTLEEQIGGQLKAGFTLLDLYEDTNGAGPLHEKNVPTFIATRSRKPFSPHAAERTFFDAQIARIARYEAMMDAAQAKLNAGITDTSLAALIAGLEAYYASDDWKLDYAADEAGALPGDLNRGVLSQDGLWNLLERYKEITDTE